MPIDWMWPLRRDLVERALIGTVRQRPGNRNCESAFAVPSTHSGESRM